MKKSEILEVIKKWKLSKKITDFTDTGLIELASKILEYELKRGKR
jgi:hypothetical protein